MSAQITVVGSLNMDLVIQAPQIPEPGETVLSSKSLAYFPGGKGANQAVAAANLGAAVKMVGKVGDDGFAEQVLESMKDVDTSSVIRDLSASTGVALIVVDDAGENTIVVASGANAQMKSQDIPGGAIEHADTLVMQLEIPLETVARSAELAKSANVPVILNTAPATALPSGLLQSVDILIANQGEAALLSGITIQTRDDFVKAANHLQSLGPETIIFTLGGDGALLVHNDQVLPVPAFRVDVVDTTAAGDAFVGGFAVAFAEGKTLEEAVRFGNAAGALAATKMGAQPSLPARPELDRLVSGE